MPNALVIISGSIDYTSHDGGSGVDINLRNSNASDNKLLLTTVSSDSGGSASTDDEAPPLKVDNPLVPMAFSNALEMANVNLYNLNDHINDHKQDDIDHDENEEGAGQAGETNCETREHTVSTIEEEGKESTIVRYMTGTTEDEE